MVGSPGPWTVVARSERTESDRRGNPYPRRLIRPLTETRPHVYYRGLRAGSYPCFDMSESGTENAEQAPMTRQDGKKGNSMKLYTLPVVLHVPSEETETNTWQKSRSCLGAGRGATPRRKRWNTCEAWPRPSSPRTASGASYCRQKWSGHCHCVAGSALAGPLRRPHSVEYPSCREHEQALPPIVAHRRDCQRTGQRAAAHRPQ